MGRRVVIAVAYALSLAPAHAAESPEVVASLAKARRWVKTDLRYADAIARLELVLASPSLNLSQRVEANELLAYAAIALGDASRAERAFSAILEVDPAYRLPTGTSPKIAEIFALTQARRAPPPPPPPVPTATLAVTPPAAVRLDPPAVEAVSEAEAWYQKWWVWTILGAAAVGGASTAIVLSQQGGAPSGTLAPIRVP